MEHDHEENPYEYFVGKPVTVVTLNTSLRFTPDSHLSYFVGILRSVDEWTCTLVHPVSGCRSLFRLEHVVAMHEEQQVDPENAEDLKLLQEQESRREEFRKRNPNLFQRRDSPAPPRVAAAPDVPYAVPPATVRDQEKPFFDLDQLQDLAKLAKGRQKP